MAPLLIPGLSHLYQASVVNAPVHSQTDGNSRQLQTNTTYQPRDASQDQHSDISHRQTNIHSTAHFGVADDEDIRPGDVNDFISAKNVDIEDYVHLSMNTTEQVIESDKEEGEVSDVPQIDSPRRKDASRQDDLGVTAEAKRARKKARREEKRQKKLEKQRQLDEAAEAAEKERKQQAKEERRLKKKQRRQEQASQAQPLGQMKQPSVVISSTRDSKSLQKPLAVDLAAERQQAKEFIRKWALNGFTFQQLLGEGLDSLFLRSIYHELNLDTTELPQRISAEPGTPIFPSASELATTDLKTMPVGIGKPVVTHEDMAPSSTSVVSSTAMEVNGGAVPPTSPAVLPSKPAAAQYQAATAINRKEYIARLLAARAKNTTVPDVSLSSGSSAVVASAPASDAQIADTAIPTLTTLQPVDIHYGITESLQSAKANAVLSTQHSSLSNASLDERTQAAKRKAQTELARLRLQALASSKAANASKNRPFDAGHPKQVDLPDEGPGRRVFQRPDSMPVIEMLESGSEDGELLEDANAPLQPGTPAHVRTDVKSEELVQAPIIAADSSTMPAPTSEPIMSLDLMGNVPITTLPSVLLPLLSGQTTPNHHNRKRPVASDFDNDGWPPTKLAKRSFGEAPGVVGYQDMVIEVSDDDSDVEKIQRPSLHRLESRNGINGTSSAMASSEASVDTATADEAERLRLREEQISEMKRKILELELKRRAKAALVSRSATPAIPQLPERVSLPITPTSGTKSSGSDDGDPELTRQSLLSLPNQSPSAQSKHSHNLAPEHQTPVVDVVSTSEGQNATELEIELTDANSSLKITDLPISSEHSKRREEIRTRLPVINANFASTQSRMALLRAQMEALEAELLQEQSEKERLVRELKEYGVDTNGMQHAQLQAVKNSIQAQDAEDVVHAGLGELQELSRQQSPRPRPIDPEPVLPQGSDPTDKPIARMTVNSVTIAQTNIIEQRNDSDFASNPPITASILSTGSAASGNMSLDDDESESGESVLSSAGSPLVIPDANVFEPMEIEPKVDTQFTSASVSIAARIPSPSPKKPSSSRHCLSPRPSMVPVATDATSVLVADDLAVDNDSESDYEPPDGEPVVVPDRTLTPAPRQPPDTPLHVLLPGTLAVNTELPHSTASRNDFTGSAVSSVQGSFKPYISPLTNFKAYRYSPHYSKEVLGGLRSTTYSHAIHAQKPLCQYETLGGICNDSQCEDQHWRQMVAGDDEILRQLGTYIPGQTKDDRERYVTGLKSLINNLRTTHVTDPEAVASTIIEYRRTFLNDPTRVLNP